MIKLTQILDCTIRDGGYLNKWNFDKKIVRDLYRAVSKSGVDYIELGYLDSGENVDRSQYGLWRFVDEKYLREVTDGIQGAKIALMINYGDFDITDIAGKDNKLISLIRLAVHKNDVKKAVQLCKKIKGKGYEVSLNLMGYSNYTDKERLESISYLESSDVDYIYVADSYGSILPNQVEGLFKPLLNMENKKIGFHSHNNLQMAFANTLEALRCGVDIIDASVYGMGRGAGNLPLEVIVSYMEPINCDKYNIIPVLNLIDRYFIKMQRDTLWGYQLPYLLSGVFKCHPEYARSLVERREYTIEDIWRILEVVRKIDKTGFSKNVLENVLKKGWFTRNDFNNIEVKDLNTISLSLNEARVPYINRHRGRDFLVLANGPSLGKYKNKIDEFISRYKPVVLGANYLDGMFIPHYHAFNNKRRFADYVLSVNERSKLLIGQHIPINMIREYTNREFETLYYIDKIDTAFDIKNGIIHSNCRTISVLLAALSIVMGAGRIFIVGMDGYLNADENGRFHFYKEEEASDKKVILEKHEWNLIFLEQIDKYLTESGKEGIHILTPTAYKRFFKGINNYL